MTIKTICCQLVAPEKTRQRLWQYMAEQYTPLMTELIKQVGEHPDLSQWQDKGKMPSHIVKDLCATLKQIPPFSGLPSYFYGSAINQVNYIFASWLSSQHKLKLRLNGKRYYISMLYSDQDLVKNSGHTLTQIRSQAQTILNQISKKKKEEKHKYLFQQHRESSNILEKTAITYLIKHNHKIPTQPEQRDKFDKLYRKTEIQIERLEKQIEARLPRGRNLSEQQGKYLNDLLVRAVMDLATQYQAGSIVLPKLDYIREIVESEIKVKAEKKIPLSVDLQKKYAKTYRMNVHQWSYGLLIDGLQNQAKRLSISIEERKQPIRGSPQEQSRDLVLGK